MAAPYGNRNAEKWSFKKAIKLFNEAIELSNIIEKSFIKQGEKVIEVEAYKYDFIGEVARNLGTFHHIFEHLIKRFPSLKRLNNQFINNLESNCYFNGKKGNIKEASSIMNLKSNHNWTDRQESKHIGAVSIKTEITVKTQEEADRLKNALDKIE